jgi:hypothetical protein
VWRHGPGHILAETEKSFQLKLIGHQHNTRTQAQSVNTFNQNKLAGHINSEPPIQAANRRASQNYNDTEFYTGFIQAYL